MRTGWLAAMIGVLWAAGILPGCGEGPPSAGATAVDCIHRMARCSRKADVEGYLQCFSPEFRKRLEQARDEMGRDKFAQYLVQHAEPVRGIACSDETRLSEDALRVKVEWVFEDRNEVQHFHLRKTGGMWKIADMTEAEYRKPIIPYGTKVFE